MVLEQIRYVVAIVDTGSYTEAALELHISQSTISKQVQALERELGVSLFDRSSRKARLTAEGRTLLPEIRALFERMEHLLYSASRLRPGYAQRFSVITLPYVGYLGFYAPLGRFELENPEHQLVVTELEEPQLMRQMLSNDFDLAVTYEYEYRLSNMDQAFIPITDDEIVFVVHRDDPLARREWVAPEDIGQRPLLLMEPYTCISKLCANYFRNQQFVPNVIFRGRPETVFAGAEAGRGATLLSRKQCRSYEPRQSVAIPLRPSIPLVIGAVPGKNRQHQEQIEHLIRLLTAGC